MAPWDLIRRGALATLLGAAACGGSSPGTPTVGQLSILTPVEGATTNGPLSVSIRSTGTPPDRVTIDVDGTAAQSLAPPFDTTLDTRGLTEGQHTLHARGTSAAGNITGAERVFSVDRTPPSLVAVWPEQGGEIGDWSPASLTFDEPLLPSSVDAGAFTLTQDGSSIPLTVSLSPGGRTLTLPPGTIPTHPKPVGLALIASAGFATDLAGNPAPPLSTGWTMPFWELLGGPVGPSPGDGPVGYPHLVVASDGGPLVGFEKFSPTIPVDQVWVEGWNRSTWSPLVGDAGTVRAPLDHASTFLDSLTLDTQGRPVIGYFGADPYGAFYIRAARWSGTGWDFLGGDLIPPSSLPLGNVLASDPSGGLWALVGVSNGGYTDWYVARWDGTSWAQIGERVNEAPAWSAAGGGIQVSATGVPYVSFAQSGTSATGTMVHVLDGGAWIQLGGEITLSGHPGSAPSTPRLALDQAGAHPFVLMDEFFDTGWHSFVWRWTGLSWEVLGEPIGAPVGPDVVPPSGGLVIRSGDVPSIAVLRPDGGVPTLQVYELDGGAWTPVGPGLVGPPGRELRMYSSDVSLAVDPQGRRVIAVTACVTGGCDPYVYREVP